MPRLSPLTRVARAAFALVALTAVAPACDDGGIDQRRDGSCTGARCADAAGDVPVAPPRDVPPVDVPDPTLQHFTSVAIEPADAVITSMGPTPAATQMFRAVGTRRDGTTAEIPRATWTLDSPRVGTVDANGLFTANGVSAGRVNLRVEAPSGGGTVVTAATSVTVRIQIRLAAPGTPPEAATNFMTAMPVTDAARAATIQYPLEGAVMPNNVAPPDVQWAPVGAPPDVFRVRIEKPSVAIDALVPNTGPGFQHHWVVASQAWRAVAESEPDMPATLTVDRWDAATRQVVAGTPVRVRVTRGGIYGVVYYWNLGAGRLQRINADTAAIEDFMPNPPRRASDGRQCVACHTISRNGRMLAAEMWDGGDLSGVFDLTADLTTDPAPTVFAPNANVAALFASFNADATRLVVNTGNALALVDPRMGTSVAATGLPTAGAAHPEWSPDNANIAFITNTDGTWGVDFTRGDLSLLAAGAGDSFTARTTPLHRGADLMGAPEGGAADSHPTWSPNSRWIAFGHGTNSRSGNGTADFPGALYLVSRDGGAAVRLDHANGGPTGAQSYWPTFAPFTTTESMGGGDGGGATAYVWLAFHSRRDYGNALAGTRGTRRRQLWVTAISMPPAAGGGDPSNVPYWLPGQRVGEENMAAYWAPQPCRENGATCRSSAECCSGTCNASGRCEPPPPAMCRMEGRTCSNTGDCCMGLMCIGNVCGGAPPG